MSITDNHLLLERPHLGGVQRVYRFPSGFGLSAVNASMLHSYTFAWEIAVLRNVHDNGSFDELTYDTPLTSDVEVFKTDDEANAFIARAFDELGSPAEVEAK